MFTVCFRLSPLPVVGSVLVHAAAPLPQTGITIDTQTGTEEEGGKEKEKRAPDLPSRNIGIKLQVARS